MILKNIIRKVIGESRASLSNSPSWLVTALTGTPTAAGVTVNEGNALQISAVWACVKVISETIASLPLFVFRRSGGNDRQAMLDHPLHNLLHTEPNPQMTSMQFRETLQMHVLTWGNGYAAIERAGGLKPTALWPIDPSRVDIEINPDRRLVYVVRVGDAPNQETQRFTQDEILHIRGPSPDGLKGYSVIRLARESMGLASAAEKYAAGIFGNSSTPRGVLEHPGSMEATSAAQFRKDWERLHKGPDNAHKTAILQQGMKFHPMSMSPDDSQMLESRQFEVEEITRWFNVPPHKIQHLLRATFSNIDSQQVSFATDTIRPWLVRWEQEYQRKLFAGTPDTFAEHVLDAVLRGDPKSRAETLEIQSRNGIRSIDEWRALENLNALPGGVGAKHFVQLNLAAVEDLDRQQESPPAEGGLASRAGLLDGIIKAHKPLLADVIGRVLRTEADKVKRAQRRETDLPAWLDRFYADHQAHVRGALIPAVNAFVDSARAICGGDGRLADLDELVATTTAELAGRHVETSRKNLAGGDIDGVLAQWRATRAADDAGRAMCDLIDTITNRGE